ncbi:helix-turn-helix domain-containing protein [Epilithonimonas sp.]|uniref:helix-turn-helix domain-containing protein n=1 Tax=Epilithonimonas sp. TaxID=2894511 RepID=UPI0035AE8690
MFKVVFLWLIVFCGIILTPAQNNPETLRLLNKATESLYENPDNVFQILQNIDDSKESELIKQRVQIILARAYNLKGDYAKSLEQSLSKNLKEYKDDGSSLYSDFTLAQQYQSLRLYKQSIRLSQSLVDKLLKTKLRQYPENLPAQIYQLNASNLMIQKKWREAELNLKLSNALLKNTSEDFLISIENQIYQTIIYISVNKIDKAERSAVNIQEKLNNKPQYIFLRAFNLDNFGKINFLKKDYQKSAQNLNDALQIIDKKPFLPLKNRIYDDLSKNYLVMKNEQLYQKYYSAYREETDRLDQSKKEAIRNLIRLNDLYEKKRLDQSFEKSLNKIMIILGIAFFAVLSIILLTMAERRKAKSFQKQIDFYSKQQILIKKNELKNPTAENKDPEVLKKPLLISKEKELDILARLEEFEKSDKFLNRDMSLAVLAGQLDTNTKYLSEIINKYKQKNYNNYINELRINHIAYLLTTEPAYLSYKVSYLAEKAGFSSHSAFTTVFKSVTGISPNTYIRQLTYKKI